MIVFHLSDPALPDHHGHAHGDHQRHDARPQLTLVPPVTSATWEAKRAELSAVIEAAFQLAEALGNGSIRLRATVPERFPALPVNADRLRHVLLMLMRISLSGVPTEGELDVTVTAAAPDLSGPWVQISLADWSGDCGGKGDGSDPRAGLITARRFAATFGGRIYRRGGRPGAASFVIMVPRA